MLSVVLALITVAASPQASPTPLVTIAHDRSTPFCTAFTQNIRYSVQGVLLNDSLFKRTEPVFLKAAHDMLNSGVDGFSSKANGGGESAAVMLDMNRLEQVEGAIVHNLQTINDVLNDPTRFPKQPNGPRDAQLVQLRAQLLTLAKKQNDELNLVSGTADQYMFDTLYNRDISMSGSLSANGKALPDVGTLRGGPMQDKATGMNPLLASNNLFMNSPMGRMYRAMVVQESQEAALEPLLAQSLADASTHCR